MSTWSASWRYTNQTWIVVCEGLSYSKEAAVLLLLISPCLNLKEKSFFYWVTDFIVNAWHSGVESIASTTALQCSCSAWFIILGWGLNSWFVYFGGLCISLILLWQCVNFGSIMQPYPLACLYCGKHSLSQLLLNCVKKLAWIISIMPKCTMWSFSH